MTQRNNFVMNAIKNLFHSSKKAKYWISLIYNLQVKVKLSIEMKKEKQLSYLKSLKEIKIQNKNLIREDHIQYNLEH